MVSEVIPAITVIFLDFIAGAQILALSPNDIKICNLVILLKKQTN